MPLTMSLTREQMLIEMDQAIVDEIAKQSHSNRAHHIATDGKLIADDGRRINRRAAALSPAENRT